MALTTILLDNDGTIVDTYNMILESFKHATQEVLGKQFSEAEYMAKVGQPLATQMLDFARNAEEQQRLLKAYRKPPPKRCRHRRCDDRRRRAEKGERATVR